MGLTRNGIRSLMRGGGSLDFSEQNGSIIFELPANIRITYARRLRGVARGAEFPSLEVIFRGLALLAGSPVAASSTLPPLSRAIPARKRLLTADLGCVSVISSVDAY